MNDETFAQGEFGGCPNSRIYRDKQVMIYIDCYSRLIERKVSIRKRLYYCVTRLELFHIANATVDVTVNITVDLTCNR